MTTTAGCGQDGDRARVDTSVEVDEAKLVRYEARFGCDDVLEPPDGEVAGVKYIGETA
jgi:hypothetical protein